MKLAKKISSHLLPHAKKSQCHHSNSHNLRKPGSIPPKLRLFTPFFNSSILNDHKEHKKEYKSLKIIKQDLKNDKSGKSPNPFHVGNSLFKSPSRMLQQSGMISEIDPEIMKLPAYMNWAEDGKTTKIKFQGVCRSCYTFSGLASVESAILIK